MSYISNHSGVLTEEFHPLPKPEKVKKEKGKGLQSRSRLQAKKSLNRSKVNKPKSQKTSIGKQVRAEVFLRDKGRCQNPKCGVKVPLGTIPHHLIIKGYGGRGVLKELVDSLPLRILLCDKCHTAIHHTGGGMKGYDFYIAAAEQGYRERVVLMELLINEWAKSIPLEIGELAQEIRQRNTQRWNQFFGFEMNIDDRIVGEHWKEILVSGK